VTSWPCDQSLPSILTPGQLMQVLGMKRSIFYRHQRAGAFKHLEVTRPVGTARYSGVLVDRYRRGVSTVQLVRRTA
jgi:hypothetical protein